MEIVTVISAISEFGVLVVIAAVFLYTVIRIINILLNKFEAKLTNKAHDVLLDMRFDISKEIQSLLDIALQECSGNRIQVIEFSNSVMSVAYLPFKYMTCTYEVYTPDRYATSSRVDHLSTSLFTSFFSKLQKSDYVMLDLNNRDSSICGAMYDILRESGDTMSLCIELTTARGKSVGYISLKKSDTFEDNDIEVMQTLADKLSALLSVADK